MSQLLQQQVIMGQITGPVIEGKTVTIWDGGTSVSDTGSSPVKPSIGNQYWEYSATHVLVRSTEINSIDSGPKILTGIDIQICIPTSLTTDPDYNAKNISVFLAHTPESFMSSTIQTDMSQSASSFDYSDRIEVINTGDLPLLTSGFQTLSFDTNFEYDGTSNLVFSFYNEGSTSYQSGRRTASVYGNSGSLRTAAYGSDSASNPEQNAYGMTLMNSGNNYNTPNLKINY